MFSKPDDPDDAYVTLKARLLYRLKAAKIDDEVVELARRAYDGVLRDEHVVLSRAEHQRLFKLVLNELLAERLKKE